METHIGFQLQAELSACWSAIVARLYVQPRCLEIPGGRTVLAQGRVPDCVYRVESGLIKLLHRTIDGDEHVVSLVGHGRLLSVDAVVLGHASRIGAVAVTDVRLSSIPAVQLDRRAPDDPVLSWALLKVMCFETHEHVDRLALLLRQPARRRLECLLRQLAEHAGQVLEHGCLRLDLNMTQHELATVLNMTPETLSRAMAELQREGVLLRRTTRTLYLTNKPTVSAMARVQPTTVAARDSRVDSKTSLAIDG
jgi:CRP/FNR family transcriptional regulator, cyclic AMP receptor protein